MSIGDTMKKQEESIQKIDIRELKQELMVNIEGICNNLKGTTRLERYSFGIDVIKLALKVFLLESKTLIFDRDFKKSDIIVFYDDTLFRTGVRGFGITKDEIITNIHGFMKVLRFNEMTHEPTYVTGPKRDVIRIYLEEKNHDIKVRKHTKYQESVFDIIKLLYKYSTILKEENYKAYRVVSK